MLPIITLEGNVQRLLLKPANEHRKKQNHYYGLSTVLFAPTRNVTYQYIAATRKCYVSMEAAPFSKG